MEPTIKNSTAQVIAIVGATATGKSGLADALAHRCGGELISADSIQVYRGLDIGTAKTPKEQRSVPYHCIDLVEPDFAYSAALYQRDARAAIEEVLARGKTAVVCGGTGLYVRAALDDFKFDENHDLYKDGDEDEPCGTVGSVTAPTDLRAKETPTEPCAWESSTGLRATETPTGLRARLEAQAEEMGSKPFHALLASRDAASAALIHPNNIRRVVRAFELLEQGGSYAAQHAGFSQFKAVYPTQFIGLKAEHELLYEVIERRVDRMMELGLLDELAALVKAGYRDAPAIRQGIGYKELLPVLDGAASPEEAVDQIKQSTRRYAKRQRTWFKRDPRIKWLDASEEHRLRLAGRIDAREFTGQLLERALQLLKDA